MIELHNPCIPQFAAQNTNDESNVKENLIGQLPPEMQKKILSFLQFDDLIAAGSTCRELRAFVPEEAAEIKAASYVKLVQGLIEYLTERDQDVTSLQPFLHTHLKGTNLLSLKVNFRKFRHDLAQCMSGLNIRQLDDFFSNESDQEFQSLLMKFRTLLKIYQYLPSYNDESIGQEKLYETLKLDDWFELFRRCPEWRKSNRELIKMIVQECWINDCEEDQVHEAIRWSFETDRPQNESELMLLLSDDPTEASKAAKSLKSKDDLKFVGQLSEKLIREDILKIVKINRLVVDHSPATNKDKAEHISEIIRMAHMTGELELAVEMSPWIIELGTFNPSLLGSASQNDSDSVDYYVLYGIILQLLLANDWNRAFSLIEPIPLDEVTLNREFDFLPRVMDKRTFGICLFMDVLEVGEHFDYIVNLAKLIFDAEIKTAILSKILEKVENDPDKCKKILEIMPFSGGGYCTVS